MITPTQRSPIIQAILGLSTSELIDEIFRAVGNRSPSDFIVGITDNPVQRKAAHGDPIVWYQWHAESEDTARQIERLFLSERVGMQGGVGGCTRGAFVYIYFSPRRKVTLADLLGTVPRSAN